MFSTRRTLLLGLAAAPMLGADLARAADRPTIAIDTFDGAELTAGTVTQASLVAILADILLENGQFSLIEAPGTGARFLLRSAVTRYDPAAGGAGVQVGGLARFGRSVGAGAKAKVTTVGLAMRMIEAASGGVIAAARAEGSATGQEADAGLLDNRDGSTMGANAFRGTSVAKAFEIAMRKALDEVIRKSGAFA